MRGKDREEKSTFPLSYMIACCFYVEDYNYSQFPPIHHLPTGWWKEVGNTWVEQMSHAVEQASPRQPQPQGDANEWFQDFAND